MTARQPRRRRRRQAAAAPLPRPGSAPDAMDVAQDESGDVSVALPSRTRRAAPRRAANFGQRTHHVTTDFSYVRRDLWLVSGVSLVTLGFILAMWAIL